MEPPKVLTIAGFDPCGGAGIAADLKTFQARGVYGMGVVTAVTAQNTVSFAGTFPVPASFVGRQIDSVMSDIGADVWKTGMLVNDAIIRVVSQKARQYVVKYLVVDPVMVSKTGSLLLTKKGRATLVAKLLPLAFVITPNTDEAEELTGIAIKTKDDMKKAATLIHALGPRYVVVKGGHLNDDKGLRMKDKEDAVDVLYDGKRFYEFRSPHITTRNTHGSGCIFASALAAEIAKGNDIEQAAGAAKRFVTDLIKRSKYRKLGKGNGPLVHSGA